MAGMGPPPNPNARRTNSRVEGFTTLPPARTGPAPKLPGGVDWLPATRAAWKAWWASPQASQWTDDDVPQVVVMAAKYQAALEGDQAASSEFRQWSDRFGMSPLARLKNRWLLPTDEEPATPRSGRQRAAQAPMAGVVRLHSA
jgi:hypothetical protein